MKKIVIIFCCLFIFACLSCGNGFVMPDLPNNSGDGYIHFSIDDSNSIFEDLTKNEDKYKTVFDQPYLKFVKGLHDKYGAVFSFYLFYSWDVSNQKRFRISDTTDKYAYELSQNSDWLRFGFHAADANSYQNMSDEETLNYYNETIKSIIRITGTINSVDNCVRLDRFVGSENLVKKLLKTNNGIKGLLCSDDINRLSYYFDENQQYTLFNEDVLYNDDIFFTPTDIRVENIKDDKIFYESIKKIYSQNQIIIFTHEWCLSDESVKKYLSWYCEFSHRYGINNKFPEDMI